MLNCPKCKQAITPADVFCGNCGQGLSPTIPPPPGAPTAPPPVTAQVPVVVPMQAAQQPTAVQVQTSSSGAPKRPRNVSGRLIAIALTAVGLAAAVVAFVVMSGGDGAVVAPSTQIPTTTAPTIDDFGTAPSKVNFPGKNVSELSIDTLISGTGTPSAKGDKLTVNYVGVRAQGGEQFDSSFDRGEPFNFTLGAGEVIAGWDKGLVGVRKGDRVQLDVPASLGYGDKGAGAVVGPGDSLTFVVDIVDIVAAPPATSTTLKPTTTVPDPEALSLTQLENWVSSDLSLATQLVGQWVPQVSAKYIGLQYQGVNYTAVKVLEDHKRWRDGYGAVLVSGRNFAFMSKGQQMTQWYFSIIPITYLSKADAQTWCDSQGLGPADCFPKLFPART